PSKAVSDFIVETHQRSYKLPPLDLLDKESGKPSSGDVKSYAETIKRTLKNFGIEVEMSEVNVGPTVTQYTLKPAQGIKLAKIVALQNDLSLALAAHPLRIEAPIPGRSLVGIEIPNKVIAVVKLRELIDTPTFIEASPLTISLGKDVSGNARYADIEKMPHLLIAGATGSGKSVCVHTILNSLLYKNFPQMLKLLMVDPKRVELSAYNGIPHLLAPVINERRKAIAALNWAVKEMERRYEFLASHNVRNIGSYNSKVAGKADEKIMPYIVIVIDELADLMSESPREVEAAIVRLAQMSRAVGLHLIISTQRPSVDVITGLIKANIPCRIALQVTSLVDSRTILDMSGAEKLLGSGDMLYLPSDASKPRRIQNAALERKQSTIDMDIDLDSYSSAGSDDELFEEAKKIVVESRKASTSYLQRRLRIGYSRAARLIDMLEEDGVIGPADGAKQREIYMSKGETEGYGNEQQ
ncbi:DNA translocase FtsK, partial [Candidatus Azambacteria bacterium]|nr:DNA translocase FtsK [Candidatus Azambacteria bacterium]